MNSLQNYLAYKSLVSILTVVVAGILFLIVSAVFGDEIGYAVIFAAFAAIGIFLYGMPVSILIDFVLRRVKKRRALYAFFLHLLFVFLPFSVAVWISGELSFFYTSYMIGAAAFLYWLVDEGMKRSYIKKGQVLPVPAALLSVISIVFISLSLLWFFTMAMPEKDTPVIYQVPKDYRGWVEVKYGKEGAAALHETKDGTFPIQVNDEGKAETSSPVPSGSIQYEWIKRDGKRESIPHTFIHGGVLSSSSERSGESYRFYVGTEQSYESEANAFEEERDIEELLKRKPYAFYLPKGYRGWVVIELGDETGEEKAGTPYEIVISKDGKAQFSKAWIDYVAERDAVYEVENGEYVKLPQPFIHEPLLYPSVFVFFVGSKEEFANASPFDYASYIEEKEKER